MQSWPIYKVRFLPSSVGWIKKYIYNASKLNAPSRTTVFPIYFDHYKIVWKKLLLVIRPLCSLPIYLLFYVVSRKSVKQRQQELRIFLSIIYLLFHCRETWLKYTIYLFAIWVFFLNLLKYKIGWWCGRFFLRLYANTVTSIWVSFLLLLFPSILI